MLDTKYTIITDTAYITVVFSPTGTYRVAASTPKLKQLTQTAFKHPQHYQTPTHQWVQTGTETPEQIINTLTRILPHGILTEPIPPITTGITFTSSERN